MPEGAEGEIAKVAAPPVELTVNPVAVVLTERVSEAAERVKAGAANAVAGKTAVITPELAECVTVVAPATVKKFAVTPVSV
jgi:hypothetical protein